MRAAVAARPATAPVRALHRELPAEAPGPAAVLCPVFAAADGDAHLILTRRAATLRSHTGEVSFPGGRLDPGEGPEAAALREAQEEVGIEPATVEVIGRLSPLVTPRNPAPIVPVVGILPAAPTLVPNPAEVERAFAVAVSELFADGVGHQEIWPLGEPGEQPMYFFSLIGDTVWGATARMLRELLDRLWGQRPSG